MLLVQKQATVADMYCVPFDVLVVPPAGDPFTLDDPAVALFRQFDKVL